MLQLPNVSLVIFNPAHGSELSASIVRFLTNNISFGEVVHLADKYRKGIAYMQSKLEGGAK